MSVRSLRIDWRSVATLGLGIAISVAVAAVAYELEYAPPREVREPSTLLSASASGPGREHNHGLVSFPEYQDLRDRGASSIQLAASFQLEGSARAGARPATRVTIAFASDNYFQVVGTAPARGRTFGADERAGDGPVSVVSERLADGLGADAVTVGATLTLNGIPTTVIGIVPRRFKGLDMRTVDVWVPLAHYRVVERNARDALLSDRERRWLTALARIQPGLTVARAQEQLSAALQSGQRMRLARLQRFAPVQSMMGSISLILQACVALVMLIAVANAAGLIFANNLRRRREFAIRVALGCGRRHLIGLVLGEGVVLGFAALAAAIPLSQLVLFFILRYSLPAGMSEWLDGVTLLRPPVILTAIGLGVGAGVAASVVPALRLTRAASRHTLQQLSAGLVGGLVRPSRFLLALQTALAVTLMLIVGLLLQTRNAVLGTPTGLDGAGVWLAMIEPTQVGYTAPQARLFIDRLSQRMQSAPEFLASTLSRQAVLQGSGWAHRIVDGPGGDMGVVGCNVVSANYFAFFGLTPAAGRVFDGRDTGQSGGVMVINDTLARLWGGPGRALGASVQLTGERERRTVVGIVKEVKYQSVRQPSRSYFYLPLTQRYAFPQTSVAIHFRARTSAGAAEAALKRIVADLDPNLAVFGSSSLKDAIGREVAIPMLLAAFVSAVSIMAVFLVCLGLNAALAQAIGHAQKEMALRLALGSDYWKLQGLLSGRLLWSVSIGVAFGWAGGAVSEMALNSVLVEASLLHPGTVALVLVTIVACIAAGFAGQLRKMRLVTPREVLNES